MHVQQGVLGHLQRMPVDQHARTGPM
jgi:hypothetical protein